MENILKKTIYIGLIGFSLAGPIVETRNCLNGNCEKQNDVPTEQNQGSGGWSTTQIISTASGTTQYVTAPYDTRNIM